MTDREQEPVAWELRTDRVLIEITNNPERAHDWKASLNDVVPLYAAPRTWVGLTEEELYEIYDESDDGSSPCGVCGACSKCKIEVAIAQAIEAKLRSKNT